MRKCPGPSFSKKLTRWLSYQTCCYQWNANYESHESAFQMQNLASSILQFEDVNQFENEHD